ncbi:uncharacterized protein [Henckelia pumila]|uniref:uncharacterized protein n=1 Tax=Henckelia pumila TaxID=405737 RepID=UPI003C6DF044
MISNPSWEKIVETDASDIGFGVMKPVSFSDMKCDIPELKGDNYKIWKERIILQLGWMDIDYAIRKDEPPAITENNIPDDVDLYEKWERSNRFCHNNVKDLLKAIDEQFQSSDKALVSTLIMEFSSLRLTNVRGVREHIMKMRDIAA